LFLVLLCNMNPSLSRRLPVSHKISSYIAPSYDFSNFPAIGNL
jgi:hypothetical protein